MSLQGDITRKNDVEFFCKKLAEKIQQHPETAKVLKELGREVLDILPAFPKWTDKYRQLFRE